MTDIELAFRMMRGESVGVQCKTKKEAKDLFDRIKYPDGDFQKTLNEVSKRMFSKTPTKL